MCAPKRTNTSVCPYKICASGNHLLNKKSNTIVSQTRMLPLIIHTTAGTDSFLMKIRRIEPEFDKNCGYLGLHGINNWMN